MYHSFVESNLKVSLSGRTTKHKYPASSNKRAPCTDLNRDYSPITSSGLHSKVAAMPPFVISHKEGHPPCNLDAIDCFRCKEMYC